MRKNVANTDLFTLRCSAQGRELAIISKDKRTNLYMRFDDYPLDVFRNRLLLYHKHISQVLPDWLDDKYKEMIKK